MNITIIGPRSVGKTTTAILLAEKIGYTYVSSDDEMDEVLQPYGGLSKVLRDKRKDIINPFILPRAKKVLAQNNIVFDHAGGSLTVEQENIGARLATCLQQKSIVIGLLPSINDEQAINFLYKRERERPHFEYMTDEALYAKVRRNYLAVKKMLLQTTRNLVYTAKMTPAQVVTKCCEFLK